jgi:hypothetical protein
MRKSNGFLLYLALSGFCLGGLLAHGFLKKQADVERLEAKCRLTRTLELTDLCLFTEASYTRHLSQADIHTPFQDYPMSLDHFPSGAIVPPPEIVRRSNGKVD